MAQIILGRDQAVRLDGQTLEGTREIDLDLRTISMPCQSWDAASTSTLVLVLDPTLKINVLWKEDADRVLAKLNKHPPEPMQVSIDNIGDAQMVPTGVSIKQPLGVMEWQFEFKPYDF